MGQSLRHLVLLDGLGCPNSSTIPQPMEIYAQIAGITLRFKQAMLMSACQTRQ